MASDATFQLATRAHAEELAPQMRQADVAELRVLGKAGPLEALLEALEGSELAYTARLNGEVAAMFGVFQPLRSTVLGGPYAGVVWMLSGRAVDRHKKAFLRLSRRVLGLLLEYCGTLMNLVDAKYTGAIRWAEWLGFSIGEARPHSVTGQPVVPILIRRQSWAQLHQR